MNIKSAQYYKDHDGNNCSITVVTDEKTLSIPLDPENTDYAEILKQVQEGTLTIQDAD